VSLHTHKKITQEEILKLIENFGYIHKSSKGSHLLFRHSNINSILVLRNAPKMEILPFMISRSIIKNIVSSGVATEEEIEKFLSKN
jgi:predicted RNA binding protein YcfA (HicA-like mRNA interferase family)